MKTSVDGKAEGRDGIADWVDAWSEDFGLTSQIDACVLGAGMYPGYEWYWTSILNEPQKPVWITGNPPTPAEIAWARFAAETPHYVLSRTLTEVAFPNTTLVQSLDDVAKLKQRTGKDMYLIGGAQVTAACIDEGLVDELRLIIFPLIAGEGKSPFPRSRRPLELQKVEQLANGRASLVYRFG